MCPSTILQILGGTLLPNSGTSTGDRDWAKGQRKNLENLLGKKPSVAVKAQFVEKEVAPRYAGRAVGEVLAEADGRGVLASVVEQMELGHLMERRVDALSGG